MPLLLDGRQPDEVYLQEIAAFLGIDKRLTHLPHELSGGQQQPGGHRPRFDRKAGYYLCRRAHRESGQQKRL